MAYEMQIEFGRLPAVDGLIANRLKAIKKIACVVENASNPELAGVLNRGLGCADDKGRAVNQNVRWPFR
jgi:hypothetical protein